MEPSAPAAPSGPGMPKLSSAVLIAMAGIASLVLASIFGYILFLTTMRLDERLWWTGLASFIFAGAFFLLYAGTHDKAVIRPLAAGFFLVGAGSFYGSIFTNGGSQTLNLIWIILLSIIVLGILFAIFYMSRDAEREAMRKAQRRLTP
jgi:hypothetical protein